MASLNFINERVTHSNVTKKIQGQFCMILINDLLSNISPLKPTKYLRKMRELFFVVDGGSVYVSDNKVLSELR